MYIEDLTLNEIADRMLDIAPYCRPSRKYSKELHEEFLELHNYCRARREKEAAEHAREVRERRAKEAAQPTETKPFINGYGEATHKMITSTTYERCIKRQNRDFDKWFKR